MEDNKLIAEFMGWTFTKREDGNYDLRKDGVESWDVCTDADFKSGATYSGCFSYSEWNDIMPVVDRIESIHGVYRRGGLTNGGQMHNAKDTKYIMEYGRYNRCIAHSYAQDRLSAEYNAIVEFIKFYNQNNIRQNGYLQQISLPC